ncbi:glycosyltransferase family 4 protein [Caminibacter pacificus]|uniref:Glycosyltransferase family 4 protein n=1 Tax=Caminibacter pacificus TaxID=1424653 RepID=A0ABX5TL97_9BACT|nr:glycosyltransferase family 4 protein [Caminibacter pacificus]
MIHLDEKIKLVQLGLLKHSRNKFETLLNTIKRVLILKQILKNISADVNISFMTQMNILSIIASRLNLQKIIVSEDIEYFFYSDKKALMIIRKLVYKLADMLIVKTMSDKKNYYFLKKVKVINNPLPEIPLNNFKKEHFILAVGRLENQKGFDTLIKIYSKIETSWKLYIAGEGSERKKLESLIKKLKLEKKVILLGNVKNIEEWYFKASIFVLSSRKEGFGNVLIEAMACGCACVAFDCPYGPSEIIENYKNGILVENQNEEKLKESIELLIKDENLRKKLAKEAVKVKEKYSIEKIAREWENAIEEVLKKGGN